MFEELSEIRRTLHREPELAFAEVRTAERIAGWLGTLGIPHRTGVGGHGIVADLGPASARPCVALRSDMDALPIEEETGLAFASRHQGVMHACGHDGHVAMLLGAASLLRDDASLPGPVRLVFQPAEEVALGAAAMVEAGALEGVGMIFGGHIDRRYPLGELVVTEGAVNASTDKFAIEITGQGGHGARPHETTDAVVTASALVIALQTIVAREVDPGEPAVVTVGSLHAGTAHNVIAGRADLSGTVRAHSPTVRAQLERSIRRICDAVAAQQGATIQLDFVHGTPPVVNTPEMTALARQAAVEVVGETGVCSLASKNLGAEDFSVYLEHVPGAYIRYGAQIADAPGFPAHSSRFDFDEAVLPIGARYLAAVARRASAALG